MRLCVNLVTRPAPGAGIQVAILVIVIVMVFVLCRAGVALPDAITLAASVGMVGSRAVRPLAREATGWELTQ